MESKRENLTNAEQKIREAAGNGAELICLPGAIEFNVIEVKIHNVKTIFQNFSTRFMA